MRITNQSVDEFLESLQDVELVFDGTVRISINKNAVEGQGRTPVKFDVVIQVATVVVIDEESSYLLEAGEMCGIDYEDSSEERGGSKRAVELKERVKAFAASKGWRTLPGIISD